MKIAGLDLSLTSTGIAVLGDDGCVTEAVKTRAEQGWLERIDTILTRILLSVQGCDAIYVENYAFGSRFSREALGELGGVVKRELLTHGFRITLVSPSQVKVFATGKATTPACPKGVAKSTWKKKWVSSFVERDYGVKHGTDDETDAFILATIGRTTESVRCGAVQIVDLPEHQQRVVLKLLEGEGSYGGKNNTKGRRRK